MGFLLLGIVCFLTGLWPLGLAAWGIGVLQAIIRSVPESVISNDDEDRSTTPVGALLITILAVGGLLLIAAGTMGSVVAVQHDAGGVDQTVEILRALSEATR
ncbi:MAG: hypothetical protein DCC57_25545 [Chloroflexi bacterium]|nr:MAG: hypothetical protein DCC57_25545 [Chloroflexota bacterium]